MNLGWSIGGIPSRELPAFQPVFAEAPADNSPVTLRGLFADLDGRLNDQTVEGLAMRSEPLLTIQYHSEACPGPLDNEAIFDRFVNLMAGVAGGVR